MADDQNMTLASLKDEVRQFVAERDWEKFHAPKNISMALAIEAAELMEHFQWIDVDQSRIPDDQQRIAIGEEISDVLCYVVALANSLDIDIGSAFLRKMQRNREKYPIDEIRGRFGHHDPSPVENQQ